MALSTVTEVIIKKKGVDKNGREWTCFGITLDDGRKASGFEPIRVGDSVAVKPNDKNPNFLDYRLNEGIHPPASEAGPGTHANAPQSTPAASNGENGLQLTREHLMRSANLYNICVDAAEKAIAPHMPEIGRTSEQFQAIVGSLYIEAARRRTDDGISWWSYIDKLPAVPIKKIEPKEEPF